MPRAFGRGTICITCSPGEVFGGSFNRSYILLIVRGRLGPRRIESWAKSLRRFPQRRDLLLLIRRNEAAQRQCFRNFGKCSETFSLLIGLCERLRQ